MGDGQQINTHNDRYRWFALLAVLAGLFSTGITITILGNSLGSIAKDIGTTPATATWVLTGQLLTQAVLMPLMGKLGDLHGHRKVFLIGLAVFVLMAIPTALAPNIGLLIVFRALGAAGAAATFPTSMAIVMHAFSEQDRVKALGWWQLVGAGSPVIGLAVGGVIVDAVGWRGIFYGQGAISLIALIVGIVVLRETPLRAAVGRFDAAGSVLLAVGIVALLLGMQLLQRIGIGVVPVALLAIAPLLLAAFIRIERDAEEPLLPLTFFKERNFTASLVAQFGANFAYMGSFIITPLLVQQRFGFSNGRSAVTMALRPLAFSIVAPIAGYLAAKLGDRRMSSLGTASIAAGMVSFMWAAHAHSLAFIFVALVATGVGMGTASPSLISAVGNTVDPHELGVANAAQSMVGQVGVVIGIGVLSTVQAIGKGDGPFALAYTFAFGLALVAIIGARALRNATL